MIHFSAGQGTFDGTENKPNPYFTQRPLPRQRTAKRQHNRSADKQRQPSATTTVDPATADIRKHLDHELRDIQQLRESLNAELTEARLNPSTE